MRRIALAVLVVAVAGCAGPAPSMSPSSSATGSSTIEPATAGPTMSAEPVGRLVVDDDLLDVLPQEVDGTSLESAPDVAAGIIDDPALAESASAIAVGLFARPGPSGTDDLAIVNVVRLRPGLFSDGFFRGWRDTYDSAACEPAGGVTGRAEAEIRGTYTYIGSCAAGVLTYHAHLSSPDVLVSVTALGDRRLGELVIAGLGG